MSRCLSRRVGVSRSRRKPMRSSAVGPDRLSIALPLLPPEAANLYTCHEVVGATACQPDTEAGQARCLFWVKGVDSISALLPLCSRKPTFIVRTGMSQTCQCRKSSASNMPSAYVCLLRERKPVAFEHRRFREVCGFLGYGLDNCLSIGLVSIT